MMRKLSYATDSSFYIPSPKDLSYMPFQRAGIEFLCKNPNINSLIGDPPGLGKTIELIGFANKIGIMNILIVCPASLRENWAREIKKWHLGNPKIQIISSSNDYLDKSADVHVVSYSLAAQRETNRFLQRKGPHLLGIDEGHYLMNWSAKRTRALLGSNLIADKSRYVITLTGTPIVNRPKEIYSLTRSLCPEALDYMSYDTYAKRYCGGYWENGELFDRGASNLDELGRRLRNHFMLRRKKKDVLKDLPDRIENIVYLDPSVNAKSIMKKMNEFDHREILKLNGVEASFEGLSTMRRELGEEKVAPAARYFKTLLEGGRDKIIVFGHHRDVLDELFDQLEQFNPVLVKGGMSGFLKQSLVDKFQTDPDCHVFIGSMGAAGVGHTLTASDYVGIIEPSYVPGQNDQSIDRAHRIGQKKSVLAEYLVFENSLDENILKAHAFKSLNIEKVMT